MSGKRIFKIIPGAKRFPTFGFCHFTFSISRRILENEHFCKSAFHHSPPVEKVTFLKVIIFDVGTGNTFEKQFTFSCTRAIPFLHFSKSFSHTTFAGRGPREYATGVTKIEGYIRMQATLVH